MKTAVVGASGFIGAAFLRAVRERHPDAVGTSFSRPEPGLVPFDLAKPDIAPLRLRETGHEAVLVTSARHGFRPCEEQREATRAVNVAGTLELARQCAREGLRVIFLSSDVVFAGAKGPYDDAAVPAPTTEYGRQKAEVERELPLAAPRHLILRLSKVFGLRKGDGTLFDEMAQKLSAGRELLAAEDHVFCPTFIDDLTRALLAVQERGLEGVVNLAAPECWPRHRMALALARALGADEGLVKKVRLHELPGMAGRPTDSSMLCARLARECPVRFTPLEECLERLAVQYRPAASARRV